MSDAPERAALGSKGRWLQVGLLSATAVAPLIARWRSLRDDDRAQALRQRAEAMRERASARFSDATQAAQTFQHALQRSLQRAGERTARQPMPDASDQLAALAALASDGAGGEEERRRAMRASFWLAGVSAGLIAAGAITYVVMRNRALARAENDALVELSLDHLTSAPLVPQAGERPVTEAPASQEPGFAPPPTFSDEDSEGAAWVGDIYTRAYGPLDDAHLPEPARRTYFATEEQALAAGYHREPASTIRPAPVEPPAERG